MKPFISIFALKSKKAKGVINVARKINLKLL